MKINDFIYRFPDTNRHGICRVRTFLNNEKVFALLTDLDTKNTSASVTNSIEKICQSLLNNEMVPSNCTFIEHYEPQSFMGHSFDILDFDENFRPNWKPSNKEDIKTILNCGNDEIDDLTFKNKRLIEDIEKIRTKIAPHIDLPLQQKTEIITRRMEIENSQISKKSLLELVNNGCSEQELQKIIKKDLSVFGELYASPFENYICFSEFPVDNGFVDFVMFTGRSRMDVFLIEIKGAEFNLFNQTGYKDFNYKMDSAIKQIRDRLGYINRNLSDFRKNVHEIRESVISGNNIFNSFFGPDKEILVDKNKDVNIHCVVIGGRTKDDIIESRKRHDFESNFKYPIKVESWDTILRKLSRK